MKVPGSMSNCISVMSGARLAWHSATASRRQINCKAKEASERSASSLRTLPRCPSTRMPKRCSSGKAKPAASVLSRM